MSVGKTLFAQVMEYLPWKTFGRIIDRQGGDAEVRTLDCANLFRVMAFSQLTWRESLRNCPQKYGRRTCVAGNLSGTGNEPGTWRDKKTGRLTENN